jgi:hypothetical protein
MTRSFFFLFLEILVSLLGVVITPILYYNISQPQLDSYFTFLLINTVFYSLLSPVLLDPFYRHGFFRPLKISAIFPIVISLISIVLDRIELLGFLMAIRNIQWNMLLFLSERYRQFKVYNIWVIVQMILKLIIALTAIQLKLNPIWCLIVVNEIVFYFLQNLHFSAMDPFKIGVLIKNVNWQDWVYRVIFNLQEVVLSLSLKKAYTVYKLSAIENPVYNILGAYMFRKNIKKIFSLLIIIASTLTIALLCLFKNEASVALNDLLNKKISIDILIIYWLVSSLRILYPLELFSLLSIREKNNIILLTVLSMLMAIFVHWIFIFILTLPFFYGSCKSPSR